MRSIDYEFSDKKTRRILTEEHGIYGHSAVKALIGKQTRFCNSPHLCALQVAQPE